MKDLVVNLVRGLTGEASGEASGESGQNVIWLSGRSVQCAVTRTGCMRWKHQGTSLIHVLECTHN